jgi:hypothetical protein
VGAHNPASHLTFARCSLLSAAPRLNRQNAKEMKRAEIWGSRLATHHRKVNVELRLPWSHSYPVCIPAPSAEAALTFSRVMTRDLSNPNLLSLFWRFGVSHDSSHLSVSRWSGPALVGQMAKLAPAAECAVFGLISLTH